MWPVCCWRAPLPARKRWVFDWLSVLGGLAGILLTTACLPFLVRGLPPIRDRGAVLQPLAIHIAIDLRVLWYDRSYGSVVRIIASIALCAHRRHEHIERRSDRNAASADGQSDCHGAGWNLHAAPNGSGAADQDARANAL